MRPVPVGSMDVPRSRKRGISRPMAIAAGAAFSIAVAIAALVSLAHLDNGIIAVERSTIVTDVVTRGTLQRSVSAAGTLVPQEVHVVAATQPGIVEDVYVKPGAAVERGTPIARATNPDLDAAVVAAASAVDVARAQLRSVEAQARAAVLAQQSAYTTAVAQARVDKMDLQTMQGLRRSGFVAEQTYQVAAIKATESASQTTVARAQIGVSTSEETANVEAARAQLQQAQAQLGVKQTEVAALVARANTSGIVQSVAVDPGTRIDAGTELARVADERDLKAVLAVPEGQVQDVALGMTTSVDTGNGVVTGRVSRIAPAAQNGTVAVDVAFAHPLPGGRPQLNVEGAIDLQTLPGVLSIVRPAGAPDGEAAELYRIDLRTNVARLVRVRLGRGSADRIEILSGLAAGDTVIVSDTSAYNGAPALRLR